MKKGGIILIGGGARSGKSALAVNLARQVNGHRLFVATAEAKDAEMQERILHHRSQRGKDFDTREVPLELLEALQNVVGFDVVVIDCLTLWLSNQLMRDRSPTYVLQELQAVIELLQNRSFTTIIVTNEVGMGIVPTSPLGRMFRDLAGQSHQLLSSQAEQIYFAVLGVMLRLRPGSVTAVDFR